MLFTEYYAFIINNIQHYRRGFIYTVDLLFRRGSDELNQSNPLTHFLIDIQIKK